MWGATPIRPTLEVNSLCERGDHAALRRGVLCHSAYRCSVRLWRNRRRRRGNREGAVLHLSGAVYRIADRKADAGDERARGFFVQSCTGISMLTWAIIFFLISVVAGIFGFTGIAV